VTGLGSGMSACHPAGAIKISANVHNEWSPVALYYLCPMPLAAISQLVKCWYKQHQQTCRPLLFTFCASRRRRKMYCGHARLSVCVSVRGHTPTLLHGPGCNLGAW